jgi:lycopene cyclase domain-containing protein
MTSLYLLLNLLTISFPLVRSFEHRIRFVSKWPSLFAGIAVAAALFLAHDIWFTYKGVWGFNPRYLTGIRIINLPLEEWLFFFTVPFACMFNYEVMNYFVKRDLLGRYARPFSLVLAVILIFIGFSDLSRLYTSTVFIAAATLLLVHVFVIRATYLGRLYLGYLVSLVPFVIVNGILTGSWIPEEVVWYDNAYNLGIRILTIPVEDSIYLLLLLLLVTTVYEHFEKRRKDRNTMAS